MAEKRYTLVAEDGDALTHARPVETDAVRSRRIFKGSRVSVLRLSFDAGQIMKEHVATAPILIQILDGHAVLDIGTESIDLLKGSLIHLDANLPHSVSAQTATHLLLIRCDRPPAEQQTAHPQRGVEGVGPSAADVVPASSGADSRTVERILARHAELAAALATLTARLLESAAGAAAERVRHAHATLLDWYHGPLTLLLDAELTVLAPALRSHEDLVDTVTRGHQSIITMIERFAELREPVEIATTAAALRVRVGQHLLAVERNAIPILAGTTALSLASLWGEVETVLQGHADPVSEDGGIFVASDATTCECGVVDEPAFPELDVRDIPHAIRHATVFGALDAVTTGRGLVLVAPHDPLPLLAQIEQRAPGRFTVNYLERGPEKWRLQLAA